MTPAQLFALSNGESELNKRADQAAKKQSSGSEVKHITSPWQSNLSSVIG